MINQSESTGIKTLYLCHLPTSTQGRQILHVYNQQYTSHLQLGYAYEQNKLL